MEHLTSEGWHPGHRLQPSPCIRCAAPTLTVAEYAGTGTCGACQSSPAARLSTSERLSLPSGQPSRQYHRWLPISPSTSKTWPKPLQRGLLVSQTSCKPAQLLVRKATAHDWSASPYLSSVGYRKGVSDFVLCTTVGVKLIRQDAIRVAFWQAGVGADAGWKFDAAFAWGDQYFTSVSGTDIKGKALL